MDITFSFLILSLSATLQLSGALHQNCCLNIAPNSDTFRERLERNCDIIVTSIKLTILCNAGLSSVGCDCGRGVQCCHGNLPGEGDQGECLQLPVTTSSTQGQQCHTDISEIVRDRENKEMKNKNISTFPQFPMFAECVEENPENI